jgi:hypothetical protein
MVRCPEGPQRWPRCSLNHGYRENEATIAFRRELRSQLGPSLLLHLCASQASFIDGRWDVRAFDFEHRTGLALPEEPRPMRF